MGRPQPGGLAPEGPLHFLPVNPATEFQEPPSPLSPFPTQHHKGDNGEKNIFFMLSGVGPGCSVWGIRYRVLDISTRPVLLRLLRAWVSPGELGKTQVPRPQP